MSQRSRDTTNPVAPQGELLGCGVLGDGRRWACPWEAFGLGPYEAPVKDPQLWGWGDPSWREKASPGPQRVPSFWEARGWVWGPLSDRGVLFLEWLQMTFLVGVTVGTGSGAHCNLTRTQGGDGCWLGRPASHPSASTKNCPALPCPPVRSLWVGGTEDRQVTGNLDAPD